jgi:DNA repair exonuclease SbcCD ATPase subunit
MQVQTDRIDELNQEIKLKKVEYETLTVRMETKVEEILSEITQNH